MSKLDKSSTLHSHFDYQPLVTDEAEIIIHRKLYEKKSGLSSRKMIDQTCYVGIEVEVEKVPPFDSIFGFRAVEDGSLRNNGMEFVSVPIRGQNIHYLLHALMAKLGKGAEFTERTSIHVHLNVRRMTVEQLVTLLITYIVVEQSLYRFIKRAGFERSRNIFCVPLSESQHYLGVPYLIYLLKNNDIGALLNNIHHYWRKYSGLNLLPIHTQGTVEFRQLGGTKDVDVILDWVNIIQCLRVYALSHNLDEVKAQLFELNTNSNYYQFLQSVFGRYAEYMMPAFGGKFEELETGIMNVKEAFLLRDSFGITKDKFDGSSAKQLIEKVCGKIPEYDPAYLEEEVKRYLIQIKEKQALIDKGLKVEKLREATHHINIYLSTINNLKEKQELYANRRKPAKKSVAMTTLYKGLR